MITERRTWRNISVRESKSSPTHSLDLPQSLLIPAGINARLRCAITCIVWSRALFSYSRARSSLHSISQVDDRSYPDRMRRNKTAADSTKESQKLQLNSSAWQFFIRKSFYIRPVLVSCRHKVWRMLAVRGSFQVFQVLCPFNCCVELGLPISL